MAGGRHGQADHDSSMVSVFREAGITVKYEENRDGHNWDNWRDRLQSGLSWLFPGPQKYVYE